MSRSDRFLAALTVVILTIGLVIVSISIASVAADVSGDRHQPNARTTYRISTLTPELLRPLVPEVTESPIVPQELRQTLEASASSITAVVRVAPAREGIGPRVASGIAGGDLRLSTVAVDKDFPRFFEVRSNGRALDTLDAGGGVWLTRRGLARLRSVTDEVDVVSMGAVALPVRGVIDDPRPTSHLQYEAITGFEHAQSYANTVLATTFTYPAYTYVQSRAAPQTLSAEISDALLSATGLETEAKVTPMMAIRNDTARRLPFEADFVQSGRALEVYAGGITACIALAAILLATALLGQALYEGRRHSLGVSACLGWRPSRIYAGANVALFLMLILAAIAAGLIITIIGPATFRALGKPYGLDGLEGTIATTLVAIVLLLQLATAAGLSPLLISKPMALLGPRPGVRRRALALSALGTGFLSAGAAIVLFVATMFYGEIAAGAELSSASARSWIVPVTASAGGTAVSRAEPLLARLRTDPAVEAAGILHWRPYGGTSLNMSVKRIGADAGRFVQATVLTGENFFTNLTSADLVAGQSGSVQGSGGACRAMLDTQAATALGFATPAMALGQRLKVGSYQRECQVIGVIAKTRIGKLSEPDSPTIHLVGSDYNTSTTLDGAPTAQAFIVFKAGTSNALQRASLQPLASPGGAPRTVSDLGERAYTRESRLGGLLAGSAFSLGVVLLCVCLALAANGVQRQRHALAVRQALGSRTFPLVLASCRPALVGAAIGALLAAAAIAALQPSWRAWGGLSAALGPWPFLWVCFGLLTPILFTFLLSQWLLFNIRPGEALGTALT